MSDQIKDYHHDKWTPGLGDFLVVLQEHAGLDWNIMLPEHISRFSCLMWGVSNFTIEGLTVRKGLLKFSPREIDNAKKMVGTEPSIIINPNCRKESGLDREIPHLDWDEIGHKLNQRFKVFQFGLSNNITRVECAMQFQDLGLRELAAAHAVIGRYAGIDSGERHLCHAVGGTAWVIRPRGIESVYNYERWKIVSPRFHYYDDDQNERFVNDILAS